VPVRPTCLRALTHRQAQTGVIRAYWLYASFLRIRSSCIASFFPASPQYGVSTGWYQSGFAGRETRAYPY